MLLAGSLFLASCQGSSGEPPFNTVPSLTQTPNLETRGQELPFHEAILGTNTLSIMLARTEEERRIGLMYRPALASGQGMLFCYDAPQEMSFWMKNTRIPLDLVFFSADLKVTEWVEGMVPGFGLPESLLPLYSSRGMAQYALELASGSIRALGVKPGQVLGVPAPLLFSGD
jgi:hypothetical protein